MEKLKKAMTKSGLLVLVFVFGSFVYGALEILWRGYTHPTMLVLGGACLAFIYFFEGRYGNSISFILRNLLYAIIITLAELAFGIILNMWLGLGVWDYSELPLDFAGQICVPFSLLWFLLSVVCCFVCRAFRFAFEK